MRNVILIVLACACSCVVAQDAQPLFDGQTLKGWFGPDGDATKNWRAADGVLSCTGEAGPQWLATKTEYDDFELTLEFNMPANANSGVFLRAPKKGTPYVDGMEVQLLDDGGDKWKDLKPDQFTGSIYAALAPSHRATKPAGQWQTMRVVCVGRTLKVWVNGEQIVYANLDKLAESYGEKVPGLKRNKGHIGFQNHGDVVSFRKIHLRKL